MIKLLHLFKTGMLTGISLAIILQSCTIEKRHYRPGYNIEFKNKSSKKLSNPIEPEQMKVDDNSTTEASINNSPENNALAISSGLAETPNQIPDFKITPKKNLSDGDGCDRIYLLNGKIIKSRISHHKDSVIRYVNCDSVGGIEYTINKRQIKAIKYANGKYIVLNSVKYENDEKFFQEDPDKIVSQEELKAKKKEEEDILNKEKPKKVSKHPELDATISILFSVLSFPTLFLALFFLYWTPVIGLALLIPYLIMLFFSIRLAKNSASVIAMVFATLAIVVPIVFLLLVLLSL